jgi:hypothetical protein
MTAPRDDPAPPAEGVRLLWADLPVPLRTAVEARLGGPLVRADSQAGGFSPGVAARLRTATGARAFLKAVGPQPNPDSPHAHRREARIAGARVFLKAVGPQPNPDSPHAHRREARIAAALPPAAPVPRLLWALDLEGWVALAFEDVDGRHPAQPWLPDELDRVLDAIADLATTLTPSPVPPDVAGRVADWGPLRDGEWRQLREDGDGVRPRLDPWSARHLDALVDLEAVAAEACVGDTLLHLDLRADNLLLTPRRVLVVDWPHARIGAPWLDAVFFVPSVAMQGGPPPEALLARIPTARAAGPAAITAALAAVAGFFTRHALLPPPPGLPTLRPFQDAQGVVAREWLALRTGWP